MFEELIVVLRKNADTVALLLVETEGKYSSQQIRVAKIIQLLKKEEAPK